MREAGLLRARKLREALEGCQILPRRDWIVKSFRLQGTVRDTRQDLIVQLTLRVPRVRPKGARRSEGLLAPPTTAS